MIRPGSRERQRVVMRPLAHARSYRKSKTHINLRKDSDFDAPGMIRPGSRERQRVGMRPLAHARGYRKSRVQGALESHDVGVLPTSRDIWTIVETPLAGARGYQKSKTHMTWG